MSENPVDNVTDASAWSEFCDQLKKAGDVILRDDIGADTFERAEGLRYLSRLTRAGLMSFVENLGPKYPVFRSLPTLVKLGLDNPDNVYMNASVNSRFSYRIRGKRNTIHYLSFAAQDQNFAAKDRIQGGAGHLEDSQLELGPDGSFEIVASREKQAGNWLPMSDGTSMILVRQTYLDRTAETPADLSIECLDTDGLPPPLDPARVPGQLIGAAMYAMGAASWFADWVLTFPDKAPMNELHLPEPETHRVMGGDPNVMTLPGLWHLAPDEILLVEATPPACDYWNFQLGNIWAESLDYQFHRTTLNKHTAKLRPDGSFRLVVAHEDPGDQNWVDTAGHHRGAMLLRWVRANAHPIPQCTVIKTSQLLPER
jgi:hypothetical protein